MKYQPQNDLIDPDQPGHAPEFAFDDHEESSEQGGDAYVIGSKGDTVQVPYIQPVEEAPSSPKRWAKPAAAILTVLFVIATAWNINRVMKGTPPPPPPSPFQVKQALYLGVMKVDAYRKKHGVAPESLSDVNLPENAYSYRRVDSDHYVLTFQNDAQKIEYDSHQPKETFFGSPRTILSMGGSK